MELPEEISLSTPGGPVIVSPMSDQPFGERGGRPLGERRSRRRRAFEPEPEPEDFLPLPHADLSRERTQMRAREHSRARERPQPSPSLPASRIVIRFGVMFGALGTVFLTAIVLATIFTWWTPTSFLPPESAEQLAVALATRAVLTPAQVAPIPSIVPTEGPSNRIGIVSGHRGIHPQSGQPDPGAICPDGLTEAQVNEAVAVRVVELLRTEGYQVDLLDEFDERLAGYRALALISIHADSCDYINEFATGFKVASFTESSVPEADARLVGCLVTRYAESTGLTFHPSVTYDMTQYHTFREVAPGTPGAIIEIGFLNLDRELLTTHPDVVASGIARGVLCYLREESLEGTPAPTPTRIP